MPDQPISQDPILVGADVAGATDYLPIIDASEPDATKNKRIIPDELKIALGVQAAADAAESNANDYADSLVVSLWKDQGNFDASGGNYPTASNTNPVVATVKKGFIWTISVAGTLPTGQVVAAGDTVRALIDSPGNTQANWAIAENNIGYVPENAANKDTDSTFAANSDTKYPSQKAVKTALDLKATGPASSINGALVLFDGLTGKILLDSTKVLSTIGGNIAALTNPGAVTFLRVNADNTVTARTAAEFLSDIGASRKTLFKSNVAQAITGTINNTIIRSQLIPAGTLMATDNIFFQSVWSKAVTTGTMTESIYFNTINSLSGATAVAVNGSATTDRYSNMIRTMVFRNSLSSQYIFPSNAGAVLDFIRTSTAGTSLTINFAVDQYLIYAMQLTNSGDTVTNEMFSAEIIR